MGNMSLENKLELIRNIRETSQNNEQQINSLNGIFKSSKTNELPDAEQNSSFGVRMFFAVVILAAFISLDSSESNILKVDSQDVINIIENDANIENIVQHVNNLLTNDSDRN